MMFPSTKVEQGNTTMKTLLLAAAALVIFAPLAEANNHRGNCRDVVGKVESGGCGGFKTAKKASFSKQSSKRSNTKVRTPEIEAPLPPANNNPPTDNNPPANNNPPTDNNPPANNNPPTDNNPPSDNNTPSNDKPSNDKPSNDKPSTDKPSNGGNPCGGNCGIGVGNGGGNGTGNEGNGNGPGDKGKNGGKK